MALRPPIFVSAVSKELKSAGQLAANSLQFPVYSTPFYWPAFVLIGEYR
jgi:CHAT domain-containing protein